MKQVISISLSKELIAKIDRERHNEPRSSFIERMIKGGMKNDME